MPDPLIMKRAAAPAWRGRARWPRRAAWLLLAALALAMLAQVRTADAYLPPDRPARPLPLPLPLDLARWADGPVAGPIDLVYLHHSVGGALLADPGPERGDLAVALYDAHPSGAGLRRALEASGYRVNEASYQSAVGHGIDMFDWLPKFRDHMDRVLATRRQDEPLPAGRRNRVVVFETCFNSNWFTRAGEGPGDPAGPELTIANAQAVFRELRAIFARHPDTLFVHLTASPLAPRLQGEPLWKRAARVLTGRPSQQERLLSSAALARRFNTWLAAGDGWLSGYDGRNVVVFDYFDLLTGHGQSDLLVYPGDVEGYDPHPNGEGQRRAAAELLPFLNRAVRRAGIAP
jgi:hypothetical protein